MARKSKAQEKYCNECAFDDVECIAMKKRGMQCLAKCTSVTDLEKRYDDMETYCKKNFNVVVSIRQQYKECLNRLRKDTIRSKN